MAYRQRILAARDAKPYEQLRQELGVADDALSLVKLTGDLVIAAFFSASKDRERVERLNTLARQLVQYTSRQGRIEDGLPLTEAADALRCGEKPIEPFHWEIEFPEVFGRENGGFDAMVGNPPFAGKNTLINSHRDGYLDWLKTVHDESHGNADLVAHFYRRAFNLLRKDGCFGLIATNTIGQGDTRSTGLRWICTHGGTIFCCTGDVTDGPVWLLWWSVWSTCAAASWVGRLSWMAVACLRLPPTCSMLVGTMTQPG